MLSEEEMQNIKEKIISHIEDTFPPEQIDSSISHIESMDSEQLEAFLEKNNLVKKEEKTDCVFCLINDGKINSVKIDETENAIAILEINPVSRGHVLIIPKEHSEKISEGAVELAKKISKKIREKLAPRGVEIVNSKMFGHGMINVVPVYKDESINSDRNRARIEELEEVKKELEKEEEKIILNEEKKEEFLWLPKRIP